jgi:hypothetical protein
MVGTRHLAQLAEAAAETDTKNDRREGLASSGGGVTDRDLAAVTVGAGPLLDLAAAERIEGLAIPRLVLARSSTASGATPR